MYYKLDENNNVIKSSLEEWSNFIEGEFPKNYCQVAAEVIEKKLISTIFIGLCHDLNSHNSNIPIVFETIVFDGHESLNYCDRYSTWKEAEDGHKKAIEWVKNGCKEEKC